MSSRCWKTNEGSMNTAMARTRVIMYLLTMFVFATVIIRVELVDYSRYGQEYIQHFGNFKYRFLTTWNFMLLSFYALLSLTCEYIMIKNSDRHRKYLDHLLKFRDSIFASIVFPLSVLVTTVFWGLYWMDRELIFPKFMEQVLPPFDNHMVHTAIFPIVLLETMLQKRSVPRSHLQNITQFTVFFLIYGIPFLGTFFVYGKFLYPFIELMSVVSFVLFCGLLWSYTLLLYMLQWPVVAWRWSDKWAFKEEWKAY